MSENFNLIWGSNASQTTVWNDSDYRRGWETIGDTPPTAQQFDALQRRNDLKAQALNNTIAPIAEANDANNRKPQTVYNVGDMQYDSQLPTGWYLLCTVGGTSGDGDITFPSPLTEDASVMDGTVVWRLHKLSTSVANVDSLEKSLAESTGYGIVSGCEPTISGLTVTVGAGIVHLADGTRKEISATNVTLDNADGTNPRIDLVYIDSTGAVAKITGTAAASPSAPTLPSGGISVAQVSVAAGATTGTITAKRDVLPRFYNTGVVNVKDFGAVGDGVHDDTAAIQAALDYVQNSGVVYFPKNRGYKITSGLVLSKNDVTLTSETRSEYTCAIKTSENITMLTITGYGATLYGLNFWGNGTETEFGTANGVVVDRRISVGTTETASNLDAEFRDCHFIYLNDAIAGYGRNMLIFGNLISNCKRGVIANGMIYDTDKESDFRGWRIINNRFHSIGNPYHFPEHSRPASMSALDSWCIEAPLDYKIANHMEIANNNVDLTYGGFYKGDLLGVKITDNYIFRSTPPFIYAPVTLDTIRQESSGRGIMISGNLCHFVDSPFARSIPYAENAIFTTKVNDLMVVNNLFSNIPKEAVVIDSSAWVIFNGNRITKCNSLYVDDTVQRNAVKITNTNYINIRNNYIRSQTTGDSFDYVYNLTGSTGVSIEKNFEVGFSEDIIKVDNLDALETSGFQGTKWVQPTMQNGFTLRRGRGYRRLFNGMVQIEMSIGNGTDNAVAFTLPVGCRAKATTIIPSVAISTTNADAYAQFDTAGDVRINITSGTPDSYELNCILPV